MCEIFRTHPFFIETAPLLHSNARGHEFGLYLVLKERMVSRVDVTEDLLLLATAKREKHKA